MFPTPPKIRFEPLPPEELKYGADEGTRVICEPNYDELEALFTERCQYVQGRANATYSMLGKVPTRSYLIGFADHVHSEYSQYEGFFDHYVLARMTRNITTKLGVAFCHHDIVLVDPGREDGSTAFSVRNNCSTAVHRDDFELL